MSLNSLAEMLGGFAGLIVAVFVFLLFVLSILTPLMIYLIHRSTRRTAIALEKIVLQNKELLVLTETSKSFSFGESMEESS